MHDAATTDADTAVSYCCLRRANPNSFVCRSKEREKTDNRERLRMMREMMVVVGCHPKVDGDGDTPFILVFYLLFDIMAFWVEVKVNIVHHDADDDRTSCRFFCYSHYNISCDCRSIDKLARTQ